MASLKELKIIQQAKNEYDEAYRKGDRAGMAAAHAKADRARGFQTTTKVNPNTKQYYQSVVSAEPPKAPVRTPPVASTFRNAPAPIKITPEQQEKNTRTFLAELKSKQGIIAAGAAGVGAGLTGGGKQYMAPETRQEIESKPALNRAFTGGQIAGSIPQFAAPYAAASKPITAAVSRLPAIAKMSPVAQKITGSVATDLAVGLPLNANYAINAEGLRGTDALKSIALNTGIDLITGGILEAVPMFLKSGKKVASKADFEALPPQEKQEVMSELERLAYESNVRKGKITPQGGTLYGNASQPIAGELPAPKKTYLHATDKEFEKFKPAGDGLIYFSEKQNGVKTKADAIFSTPANNRMIESQIDESKVRHFDPFSDPEAKAIAEKYGLPTDRSYVKWDEISPMSLEAIKKGYNSFEVLEPNGGYSRAIADPDLISITNNIRKSNAPEPYATAKGQREVPRTVTPNEVSGRIGRGFQTPVQAPDVPVQPRNQNFGSKIPPSQATGKVEQKFKDLGADTNKSLPKYEISKVRSNTIENSPMFEKAKEYMDEPDYAYEVVSEKRSLAEAKQRLQADFDGEVEDLPFKANFDGVDMDTSMGIMEQYIKEAELTGNWTRAKEWSKMIREKGTQGGQMIQSFAKYSRTPEGAVIKGQQAVDAVERQIEKSNPNLINKINTETKQVSEAIETARQEATDELGEVVEKAVRQRRAKGTSRRTGLNAAVSPIRTVPEAVASLTEKNIGELIGEYTEASSQRLAKQADVLAPKKPKQIAPLQQAFDDLTRELYKVARETLPKIQSQKKTVKATTILRSALENKENYQAVWTNAKFLLQRKYANNPDAMKLLNDFFDRDVVPTLSTKTIDTAIRQTAKDFSVDLNKIFKASQEDRGKLLKDIQDYIAYQIGTRGDDTIELANQIMMQYNSIMKSKAESVLKRMYPEAFGKSLPARSQKSTFDKVMELVNLGAYDNGTIRDIIKQKNNLPVLDTTDIKSIFDNMKKAEDFPEGDYMRRMYQAKAEQIISDKVPKEFREKFRALQRLSMMTNLRTLFTRNPLGNVILGTAENVKNIPAAGIDRLVAFKTGQRTTTLNPNLGAQAKGFGQGLKEWAQDIRYGVDTSPSRGQLELPRGKTFQGKGIGKGLNFLDTILIRGLQLGDRPFYQAAYNGRMAELKRLGVTGEEAEKQARLFALDRVFQNDSALSGGLQAIRKGMNDMVGGFPLGDLIIPFAQTPANILDKLLDYSPAGLGKALYQLGTTAGKGTFDQKKFVDTLARTFTGAGISLLTYAMLKDAMITGKLSDNKDVRNAQIQAGMQAYSIRINGKWYSYEWAQPVAGIIAGTVDAINAGADKDDIVQAVTEGSTAGVDTVFGLSVLQGLASMMSGFSPAAGIASSLLSSTSQATPTGLGQIARVIDPVVRETYDPNMLKQQGNRLLARIPLASRTLPAKVDITGQEVRQSQGRGLGARAFENFLAPYRLSEETNDPVNSELMRLQKQTGDSAVLLNTAPKYIEEGGESYVFNSSDFVNFQRTMGQTAYRNIQNLIASPEYRNMDDDEKAKAVKDIQTEANERARMEFFKNKGMPQTLVLSDSQQKNYSEISGLGVGEEQYIDTYYATKDITSLKDDSGKTIRLSESYLKKKAIDKANPGASQAELMALYHAFDVSQKVWGFN
jgi:hypothetical protein